MVNEINISNKKDSATSITLYIDLFIISLNLLIQKIPAPKNNIIKLTSSPKNNEILLEVKIIMIHNRLANKKKILVVNIIGIDLLLFLSLALLSELFNSIATPIIMPLNIKKKSAQSNVIFFLLQ